jgi:uncharacterized protein YozE (UPF0346 family)
LFICFVDLLENFDFPEGPLNDDWALFASLKFYATEFPGQPDDFRILSKEITSSAQDGRFHVKIKNTNNCYDLRIVNCIVRL